MLLLACITPVRQEICFSFCSLCWCIVPFKTILLFPCMTELSACQTALLYFTCMWDILLLPFTIWVLSLSVISLPLISLLFIESLKKLTRYYLFPSLFGFSKLFTEAKKWIPAIYLHVSRWQKKFPPNSIHKHPQLGRNQEWYTYSGSSLTERSLSAFKKKRHFYIRHSVPVKPLIEICIPKVILEKGFFFFCLLSTEAYS